MEIREIVEHTRTVAPSTLKHAHVLNEVGGRAELGLKFLQVGRNDLRRGEQRFPCGRADESVDRNARLLLKFPDRHLCGSAKRAVGGDLEPRLKMRVEH